MSTIFVRDYAMIAACVCFGCFSFDRKRLRARWAKLLFVATGLIGIINGSLGILINTGWLALSREAYYRIDVERYLVDGILLGFIFSLIFSGQLLGTKRVDSEAKLEKTNI